MVEHLDIFGVNREGLYHRVGVVTVWDNGEVAFTEGTPPEVRAEIQAGLRYPAPFAGGGLFAWIGWRLAPPMIKVKPGDSRFAKALDQRNNAKFTLSELSHQQPNNMAQ